jgi:Bacterial Ig-like domain (group 2)
MNRQTNRSGRVACMFFMPLALQIAVTLLPAQTLRITSPADGAVVHAGQTLSVVVTASGGDFRGGVGLTVSGRTSWGYSQVLMAPPYVFTVPIPLQVASESYVLSALGAIAPGHPVDSPRIKIHVEPPDTPVRLRSEPGMLGLSYVGDKTPLLVFATFADGSWTGVGRSTLTTYASDNPAVATVDSTGLVTGTGPGTANITITNAGISATVPVTVPQWVTIVPSSVSLNAARTQEFIPRLNVPYGTDQAVTWSLHPALGSIDDTGLYTAPSLIDSPTRVTVTATSVADPTKSASANVLLLPPVSVSVTPTSATLGRGQTRRFAAKVRNAATDSVTWSIDPAGVGRIDEAGRYTAPAAFDSQQTVTITATSDLDGTKTASAKVTLLPSVDRGRNDPDGPR